VPVDLKVTEAADRGLWVVGLVASTGGLDALSQVQFPSIDHVKLYDPSGHKQQPGRRRDSVLASPES
jgi:hypothetical protein